MSDIPVPQVIDHAAQPGFCYSILLFRLFQQRISYNKEASTESQTSKKSAKAELAQGSVLLVSIKLALNI